MFLNFLWGEIPINVAIIFKHATDEPIDANLESLMRVFGAERKIVQNAFFVGNVKTIII